MVRDDECRVKGAHQFALLQDGLNALLIHLLWICTGLQTRLPQMSCHDPRPQEKDGTEEAVRARHSPELRHTQRWTLLQKVACPTITRFLPSETVRRFAAFFMKRRMSLGFATCTAWMGTVQVVCCTVLLCCSIMYEEDCLTNAHNEYCIVLSARQDYSTHSCS